MPYTKINIRNVITINQILETGSYTVVFGMKVLLFDSKTHLCCSYSTVQEQLKQK